MRFKLGLGIGFAAGYVVGATSSDERRQQVEDALHRLRDNPRVRHVGDVAARDARRIGDAVEERVVHTSDTVAETMTSTVQPEGSTGTGTGKSGANNTHTGTTTTS